MFEILAFKSFDLEYLMHYCKLTTNSVVAFVNKGSIFVENERF